MNIGKLVKFYYLVCIPALLVAGPSFAPANHNHKESQNLTQQSTKITPQEAAAIAVNNVEWSSDGIRVNNPQHRADFTVEGVAFKPVKGGPEWQWQLSSIGTSSTCLIEIDGNALAAASYPVTIDPEIDDTNVIVNDWDVAGVAGEAFSSTTNGDTADGADIRFIDDDGATSFAMTEVR